MVERLVVPVDGSEQSWRAFDVALSLARTCDARIDIVHVLMDPSQVLDAERVMNERLAARDIGDVAVECAADLSAGGVVRTLIDVADRVPGSTFVIASHGRGRSAALLGSVTDELLQTTFGPMIVVGPHASVPDFWGPVIAAVDGSEMSEFAAPLAAAWAIQLHCTTWIVEVLNPDLQLPSDVVDSAYTSRLAHKIQTVAGREVQHEVLHGKDPVEAVTQYAQSVDASLIVAGTHGRTGLSRLALGSTSAGFVKRASCPVLLVRPPHMPVTDDDPKRVRSVTR